MKCVVRRGCFETNSSSMHAIVITKNDVHITHDELINWQMYPASYEHVWINKKNELYLSGIEDGFDRYPFKILTTFEDKLKYAICEYMGGYYGDEPELAEIDEMILGIVKEVIPEVDNILFNTKDINIYRDANGKILQHIQLHYKDYIPETNTCNYTYTDENGEEKDAVLDTEYIYETYDIGPIDGQSAGFLKEFLKLSNITLKEFLTNKKYVIIIDSDEVYEFEKLYNSGLINKDFIERVLYATRFENWDF